jgi:DNA-3-methyladenine glycosylase II
VRTLMRRRPLPYDADAARKHLAKSDPMMREIVKSVGPLDIEVRGQPYQSLLRAILYQQLAGPAAAAIERRFLAMFDGRIPEPHQLAPMTDEQLRTAGISRQKAGYMRSIAEHFGNGHLSDRKLMRMPDDEVIAAVTEIKGVGRWTADMLLMFCIGRPDVLPVGDLGIQNAMKLAYGLDAMPKPAEMETIAEPWRPYRSGASWYLWRRGDLVTL